MSYGTPMLAQHVVEQAQVDEMARKKRLAEAWKSYYGEFPRPLIVRKGQPDYNLIINYARLIVDKGVSFLFGQTLDIDIDEDGKGDAGDADESPEAEWLKAVWEENDQDQVLMEAGINGGVTGHVFIRVLNERPYPLLRILDPATVMVDWQPDDIKKVVRYTVQYQGLDPDTKKAIDIRQVIEPNNPKTPTAWTIVDQRKNPDASAWVTVAEENWPYTFAPIFSCQNLPDPNTYWGISDIEIDTLILNRGINMSVSNTGKIISHHAHPKTYGTGFQNQKIDISVDEMLVLPTGATLANLEMTSDLESSILFYDKLTEAVHVTTRVPLVSTGKVDNLGTLSGIALQIHYQPLLEKTHQKQVLYGAMLKRLCRALLEMGGFKASTVVLNWMNPLPVDDLVERQALVIDEQLGVSKDTILGKLGYDAEAEAEKKAEETRDAMGSMMQAFERGYGTGNGQPGQPGPPNQQNAPPNGPQVPPAAK